MATELKGALEMRKALRQFTPDLAKETSKELASLLIPIVKNAKGFIPANGALLSGWSKPLSSGDTINYRAFPKFDSSAAKRGIGYSTTPSKPNKSGFSYLATIANKSAAGAIYETAGRKNPNGQPSFKPSKFTPQGYREDRRNFNKSLNPNAGKQFLESLNSTGQLVNAKPRMEGQRGKTSRKFTGRAIFRAWAQDGGKTNAAVLKAIENSWAKYDAKVKKY